MPMEYFEQRERALLGDRFDVLYAAPQETAERGVTVSALRSSPEQFAAKADFPLEASPFCKAAFVVHQPDDLKFRPGRHPYHHAGVFYSQEPSASSAAPLLGVQPGMRVLDMCAAPGGKSSQLAAALQGRGVLVSNEYVAARADILKSNLERMGVSNAVVLNETPARIADALPEFFDRVLVDAPCSGEGMFRKEAVAVTQHSEALVKQCAELGAQILDCAAAVLAPGGQLVYSTCTFAPEEDEGQVAAFLQRHPEFTLADALGNVDYTFGSEGEANRTGGLPLDVTRVRRVWPCQGGEGHFMARLVKAGTPRALPAAGEYTPEELLWLDAAAAAGKKGKGKGGKPAREQDARAARRADSRACRDAAPDQPQGIQHTAQIQRLGGNFCTVALFLQVKEQQCKLAHILGSKIGELRPQQLFQIVLRNGGHLDDHETGGECLVQLTGAGITVVHGGNKAGLLRQRDAVVAGHIDGTAEVQHRVQHGQRFVFGHVDLIQHTKAAALGAAVYRAGPEHHLTVRKSVHANEGCCIHVHMEGDVPRRTAKGGGKVFGQHVFAGGFSACQQQVFAAEQRRQRLLPHLFAVVGKGRGRDARAQCVRQGMGSAVLLDCFQQSGVYPFLLQSFKEIRHLYKHLDFAGCLAQTGCSALS